MITGKELRSRVPDTVSRVTDTLIDHGYEAYLVGGCMRDLIREKRPKDWDVTTNATPEKILELFEHTHYENSFGTVGIVNDEEADETLKIIEITPFRVESSYSDSRRPDEVTWGESVEQDLERRDFTMNAIALNMSDLMLVDPFGGLDDIEKRRIKAVRDPFERFEEDGLRILRAIRLHAELDFAIECDTGEAISEKADILKKIAKERVRDEFTRLVMSPSPAEALTVAHKLGVLQHIVPELCEAVDIEQTKTHKYDVFNHLLVALQHTATKGWPLELRLAALFHDIGKPASRRKGKNGEFTFYGHEVIGARITRKILHDLRFSKDVVEKVTTLVRWHMFFSDTDQITHSAVRRMIRNVGKDNVWDLMNLRIADRVGIGRPKEQPFRLRKYQSMIEQVMSDPVSVQMLEIDGNDLKEMGVEPGPSMGYILHILLEFVLDDPTLNTKEFLADQAKELIKLPVKELKERAEGGKRKKVEEEQRKLEELNRKYKIQ